MPFYEYQCAACGAHHEVLRKISDPPLRKCPACGRSRLRRLVSAPVFRLKGGGWYETDFKGDKNSQRNIAGDMEPVADKPKADTAVTPSPEPAAKVGTEKKEPAKPSSPEPPPAKSAHVRKATTRRPARK
jgi:putative FmdB family regulatory protein